MGGVHRSSWMQICQAIAVIGLTRLVRNLTSLDVVGLSPIAAAPIDIAMAGSFAGAAFGIVCGTRRGVFLAAALCNATWMLFDLVSPTIPGVSTFVHLAIAVPGAVLYGVSSGPFAWFGAAKAEEFMFWLARCTAKRDAQALAARDASAHSIRPRAIIPTTGNARVPTQ